MSIFFNSRIFWLFAALCWATGVAGQQRLDTSRVQLDGRPRLRPEQIIVQAVALPEGVAVRWLPTRTAQWEEANRAGYTLVRYETRADGSADPATRAVLAGAPGSASLSPRDSTWFYGEGAALDSFFVVVGQVLHNPKLQYADRSTLDAAEIRYNYLVYEAELDNRVAEALGLYWLDRTAEPEKSYRYELSSRPGTKRIAEGAVTLKNTQGGYDQTPQGYYNRYTFPDGKSLSGQRQEPVLNQLFLLARPAGDSIVLRWGPDNAGLWAATNRAGYSLERREIGSPDNPDADTSWTVLAGPPLGYIFPWDSARFVTRVRRTDTLAVLAAQLLYGQRTVVGGDFGFVSQANEFESRYSLALLAAERSALAADALGLRYVDRDVRPGARYEYSLRTPASNSFLTWGLIQVENVPMKTPVPVGFRTQPGDHAVTLLWDREANDALFSGYQIERSEDGGRTFRPVTRGALTMSAEEGETEYFYQDSVEYNYQTYVYRLRGMTAFAELSDPAETRGIAVDQSAPNQPYFTLYEVAGESADAIELAWAMPEGAGDLGGFELARGFREEGPFYPLHPGLLPASQRTYTFGQPLATDSSYYFVVTAVDTAGNKSRSFPAFVPVVDTLAPAAPGDLKGYIDSLGHVTIVWKHNLEKDMAGYRVYYANNPEDPFAQRTVSTTPYNYFRDTVELNTLTETIYYKLQAEDRRNNRSAFSQVLELRRPDRLPPVAPVFRYPQVTDSSIVLRWIPSSSADVLQHLLYRRAYGDSVWTEIRQFGRRDTLYTDYTVQSDQLYEYSLRARDDAGLYSPYAFPAKARSWSSETAPGVSALSARLDAEKKTVTLQWQFTPPSMPALKGVEHRFYVYKSLGDDAPVRLQQLDGRTTTFTDAVQEEGRYNYAVVVMYKNGKISPMSEVASVRYFRQ